MSLCDIFPDDPSCTAPEPEPVDPDNQLENEGDDDTMGDADDMDMDMDDGGEKTMDDEDKSGGKMMEDGMDTMDERQGGKYMQAAMKAVGEWQRVKSLSEFAKLSPLMDHLMLVGVAASWAATSAMQAFRYRSGSMYYDMGKIGDDMNYWKLGDQIRLYSGLGIGGALTLTSLLATVGVATSINVMAWEYLGLGSMLAALAVGVIRLLGYDAAYGHSKSSDATKMANGKATMDMLEKDSLMDGLMEVCSMLTLAMAKEGVMYQAWNMMSDEMQMDKVNEWEMEIAERAMMMEERRGEMMGKDDKEKMGKKSKIDMDEM